MFVFKSEYGVKQVKKKSYAFNGKRVKNHFPKKKK